MMNEEKYKINVYKDSGYPLVTITTTINSIYIGDLEYTDRKKEYKNIYQTMITDKFKVTLIH